MVVCKFWLQGNCRFGNNCRNEHPAQNNNRFGVFGAPSGGASPAISQPALASGAAPTNVYNVTPSGIVKDLTEERPPWIFSAYGPGRNAPEQLFGGPQMEQSFEELRLHYYKARAGGNPQAAINDIDSLYRESLQKLESAAKNANEAAKFVLDATQRHPNRHDICASNSLNPSPGEFAEDRRRAQQPPQPTLGGFGAPSQPAAATANPFGASPFGAKPAFGQPSAPSAFGQPSQLGSGSVFGQPPNPGGTTPGGSAFGQPSQLGATTSPFGKPAQPAAAPAFGQPSQPGATTSAFGQPTQLGATVSPFGKPAQVGTATGASAFGQPSQRGGGTSAFGQPSALGQKPAGFGVPAFGQPSAPAGGAAGGVGTAAAGSGGFSKFAQPGGMTGGAFGQPSTLGTTPSPFGAAAQAPAPANPFSQQAGAAPAASSPFSRLANGSTTTAAQPAQTAAPANPFTAPSPFGQPSAQPAAQASPFGGFQNAGQTAVATSPFGQPPTTSATPAVGGGGGSSGVFGRPSAPAGPAAQQLHKPAPGAAGAGDGHHAAIDSYAQRDAATGRLRAFKGQPVVYQVLGGVETPTVQRPDGKPAKIWFPAGAPAPNSDAVLAPSAYTPAVHAAYSSFLSTGRFADGHIPETPPLREWCQWMF